MRVTEAGPRAGRRAGPAVLRAAQSSLDVTIGVVLAGDVSPSAPLGRREVAFRAVRYVPGMGTPEATVFVEKF